MTLRVRKVAIGFVKEGATLYLHDFDDNIDGLNDVAAKLKAATGREAVLGFHDIAKTEGAVAMTKDVMARFGRIDILFNTTSGGWHGRIFECTEGEWDLAIDFGVSGGLHEKGANAWPQCGWICALPTETEFGAFRSASAFLPTLETILRNCGLSM